MRWQKWLLDWFSPSFAFGGGSAPTPPAPPPAFSPPPILQSPQGQAAADEARRRAQAAHGLSANIMTGPQGVTQAPMLNNKQLLGH